ncbi:hypothetical protein M0R72_00530 [Candidatus Pacearchaeota archaeon]|jgi:hypothetical protein|nr:hypothetical protein [Candidatus Pacearchaeota archaeon]
MSWSNCVQFDTISFDHDLGEDGGTGYEVLLYLEAEVFRKVPMSKDVDPFGESRRPPANATSHR